MKKFFTLLVVCGLCLNMNAQALKNKIVLSIAPNTADVQFTVKVDEGTNYGSSGIWSDKYIKYEKKPL